MVDAEGTAERAPGLVAERANRLVYGERASPYEVLSSFAAHLGETVASEEHLVEMARLLAALPPDRS